MAIGLGEGTRRGYGKLQTDAYRLLAGAPDGIDASTLARALFGAWSGDRWVPLLPSVLGGDDRMEHVEGRWRLKQQQRRTAPTVAQPAGPHGARLSNAHTDLGSPVDLPSSGLVLTLALATTGADPRQHRIARIAVVRREAGAVTARLDVLVNAGQRLPRYLRETTGVNADDLETAPAFADAVPTLAELLAGEAVYVYGARRTRAFVEAELRRADLPDLNLVLVEVDGLLRSLVPEARKPGLFAAAAELGIQHAGRGSPLAEAELTGRVVERLRERIGSSPSRPIMLEPELADGATEPDPSDLPFTRAWLDQVPEGPGVYVMEDATGRPLYVGKAIALRRRLAAYVGRQPSQHRRLEALGVRAARVTTLVAASDLEATLLEARLIRAHQPPFNVARKSRGPTTIVRAAPDERSPSVRLVRETSHDGARYLGPFESVRAARDAMRVARAVYPAAFGRNGATVEKRRRAVLDVCRLLAGQKEPTLTCLRAAMSGAAATGDRSEVDRLRAALRAVQALTLRISFLAGLPAGWGLLVLERLFEGGPARLHLVHDSQLIASADTDTSTLPAEPARLRRFATEVFSASGLILPLTPRRQPTMGPHGRLAAGGEECTETGRDVAARWTSEDSAILLRWLAQTQARLEIRRLPSDGEHGEPGC